MGNKMHGKTATKPFRSYNRPITKQDTGVKFFKGMFIALATSLAAWTLVFLFIYEATK